MNWLHACSQFIGGCMEEKNEVIKQKTAELVVPNEQQFYTDVCFILQQARENAYNSANGIMTYAYWSVGRRIVEQEQYGEKKARYGSYLIKNLSIQLADKFGTGFSFVGRQMRICTETTDFYIDLVFYNYILKCFVVIDLKTKKLTHQDIGQMDMYVRMFDDLKRREDDNPTIGIIFCTDKDETIVKYSVLHESQQIFASKYMTVLPTVEELQREVERNQLIYDGDR